MDGDQPLWLNILWLVVLIGFFAWTALGMRKTNKKFDDPEAADRSERAVAAAHQQADATYALARAIARLADETRLSRRGRA